MKLLPREGSGRVLGKQRKTTIKPRALPYKAVVEKLKELRTVSHPLRKLKVIFEAK